MRKTMLGAAAAAGLVGLAACQAPAPAADTAKETAAIEAQIAALNAALKAGDAERAVSIDAPDIRVYGGGPDVASAAEDLKATKAMLADPAYQFAVKAEHTEVAKSGDLGWQSGTFEGSATNPKTKAVEHVRGHFVAGWKKDDQGRWKLAAVSTAPTPAP